MRAERWPSAWETIMEFRGIGKSRVEILNVSQTGIRFSLPGGVPVGTQARFKVCHTMVQGHIVRSGDRRTVMAFDTALTDVQVDTLRQYRRL